MNLLKSITRAIQGNRPRSIVNPAVIGYEDLIETGSSAIAYAKDAFGDEISHLHGSNPITDSGSSEYEEAYGVHLWIYVAIKAVADELSQTPLRAWTIEDGQRCWQPDDSPLNLFMSRKHLNLTQRELIRRWAIFHLVSGTSLIAVNRIHEDPRDPRGPIKSLRPLRPSRVGIVPGGEFAKFFTYNANGADIEIAPQNACFMREDDPNNDFWGLSKVALVLQSARLDAKVEVFNEATLDRGGSPNAVLETPQPLAEPLRRRLKRAYDNVFGRFNKSGGTAVLTHGLKMSNSSWSPKDMQFSQQQHALSRRIFAVFNVPPARAMQFQEASVLANTEVQDRVFYKGAVMPLGDCLTDSLSCLFPGESIIVDGKKIPIVGEQGLAFDWSSVSALQEFDASRMAESRQDVIAGIMTPDEARVMRGLEAVGGKAAELRDQAQPTSPIQLSVDSGKQNLGASAQVNSGQKRLAQATFKRLVRLWLQPMRDAVDKAFEDQLDRILTRLGVLSGRKSLFAGHIANGPFPFLDLDGVWKAPEDEIVDEGLMSLLFPIEEEREEWAGGVGPVVFSSLIDAGDAKGNSIIDGFEFNENDDTVRRYLENWSASKVTNINETTRSHIRQVLADQPVGAVDFGKTRKALTDLFASWTSTEDSSSRAFSVTVTELGTALNKGSFDASLQVEDRGVRLLKTWISARDSHVRDSHKSIDRATSSNPIPIRERFSNGLLYPQEPGGAAKEVIRCRCTTFETVASENIPV